MRLWVRPGVRIKLSFGFSRTVESAPDVSQDKTLCLSINHIARQPDSMVECSQQKKRTLARTPPCITEFSSVATKYPRPCWGILTPFPFETRGDPCVHRMSFSLRIALPMSKCCSHGALLHFSLQSSHLNICYYHQDLH